MTCQSQPDIDAMPPETAQGVGLAQAYRSTAQEEPGETCSGEGRTTGAMDRRARPNGSRSHASLHCLRIPTEGLEPPVPVVCQRSVRTTRRKLEWSLLTCLDTPTKTPLVRNGTAI